MEQEYSVGCISCKSTNDLCDLFAICDKNKETYAEIFQTCFEIKVINDFKYICADCVSKLENAVLFKNETIKNIDTYRTMKDEEYLDETILEEADEESKGWQTLMLEVRKQDGTTCIYCDALLPTMDELNHHIRLTHGIEPNTGRTVDECNLCGASLRDLDDHMNRCHGLNSESEDRKYPCHFCDNVYNSKKACFTHLRMKHGLKLCNDHPPKYASRDRKECHICGRDFSQKQILNNHLWKAHGFEVEKRKAFFCPLCSERVSYGTQFSAHLLYQHGVKEQVEQLEFASMDDFLLYKSAIQEETKYRFRKTTASKQTIEGVRSHYMCSQSGVYVYQGKGKRPAPERQIYKTGKACPAHMIVTETLDKVLVVFYKTHVGHGTCPYYEPREPKRPKASTSGYRGGVSGGSERQAGGLKGQEGGLEGQEGGLEGQEEGGLVCDTCGARVLGADRLRAHVAAHGLQLFPCEFCGQLYQNVDAWTQHIRTDHITGAIF